MLTCTQAGHDVESCAQCNSRLRWLRAELQDGGVECATCGDLGYVVSAAGPDQCAQPGCAASSRWGSARALAIIERVRARLAAGRRRPMRSTNLRNGSHCLRVLRRASRSGITIESELSQLAPGGWIDEGGVVEGCLTMHLGYPCTVGFHDRGDWLLEEDGHRLCNELRDLGTCEALVAHERMMAYRTLLPHAAEAVAAGHDVALARSNCRRCQQPQGGAVCPRCGEDVWLPDERAEGIEPTVWQVQARYEWDAPGDVCWETMLRLMRQGRPIYRSTDLQTDISRILTREGLMDTVLEVRTTAEGDVGVLLPSAICDLRTHLLEVRAEAAVSALYTLHGEIVRVLGRSPNGAMDPADSRIVGTSVVSFFSRELAALRIDVSDRAVEAIGLVTGLALDLQRRLVG